MPREHLRGSVAAVYLLRHDGAALLQLRDDRPEIPHRGAWVPPGGHCAAGEDPAACARREFLEETSYRLDDVHFLTRFIDDNAAGFAPLDLSVYWAVYDERQELICREGQALAFVPRADGERLGVPDYLLDLWDQCVQHARRAGALREPDTRPTRL